MCTHGKQEVGGNVSSYSAARQSMECARLTERINLGVSIGFSNGLISVRPKESDLCLLLITDKHNIIFMHTSRIHRCSTHFDGFDFPLKGRSENISDTESTTYKLLGLSGIAIMRNEEFPI